MEKQTDYIDLRGDGRIVLYQRSGLKRPKWQVRISVPNSTGYKVVSTKTDNLDQAKHFATNLYEELYFKVKAGGTLRSKTFKQVFEEWEKTLASSGPTRLGGTWTDTVARVRSYALAYFGPKSISELTDRDFNDYWIWRRTNFAKKAPSAATLKREKVCLMPLFRFAKSRGYIQETPPLETPKFKAARRSTFTDGEWQTFYSAARRWVEEGKTKATYRDRFIAQQYFLILANTGLRIGEVRNLRWSDLKSVSIDGKKQLKGWVSGKTGVREFVFQIGSDLYVKRLYDLRERELDKKPALDDLVFCHRDGKPIQSFKSSFKSLMDFAKLPIVRNGIARSIYSLRHFYATKRLESEVSPFLLAKQMGTSVEMLEKFYGQTSVNASTMKSISRGNQTAGSDQSMRYPFE